MSNIPEFKVAFKSESLLMKIIGKILFFNKTFMTSYTTTLGRTIYFTDRKYVKAHPVSTKVALVHELIHVKDYEDSGLRFQLGYAMPQILSVLAFPLFLIAPWWACLAWFAFFLAPLPAFFRMKSEEKAYTFSLYALHKLNVKNGYNIDLKAQAVQYTSNFKNSGYYFMWPFFTDTHFMTAVSEIQAGRKPFYDVSFYDMADAILELDVKI